MPLIPNALHTNLQDQFAAGYPEKYWILTCTGRFEQCSVGWWRRGGEAEGDTPAS